MTELGKQLLRDQNHAVEGLKMLDLGAAGGDPEAHRALFQFHSSGTAPNMSKALVSTSTCFRSMEIEDLSYCLVAGTLGVGRHQCGTVHTRQPDVALFAGRRSLASAPLPTHRAELLAGQCQHGWVRCTSHTCGLQPWHL